MHLSNNSKSFIVNLRQWVLRDSFIKLLSFKVKEGFQILTVLYKELTRLSISKECSKLLSFNLIAHSINTPP